MRNCFYLVMVIAIMLAGSLLQAQSNLTAGQEKRVQELEQICEQQQQQIKTLQQRLGTLQSPESSTEYTEKIVKQYLREPQAEEEEGITAGYDNGFFIRSADGDLEFKITGFVQAGLGIFENDTFDNNSFFMNGVYLTFDAYLLKDWHARIQVDFANPGGYRFQGGPAHNVALRDAFIEYIGMDAFQVRVGNTHVPFTIEGQYGETEGISIWGAPFTSSWGHGRDPGIMIYGVLNNMVEYKLSLHNGEGSATMNNSDNFLMAAQARIYFFGQKENANSYFHVGFMRTREVKDAHDTGHILSANLVLPWGRRAFDAGAWDGTAPTGEDATQGWVTGVDTGMRIDKDLEGGSNIRVEGEFMYITWERDFSAANGGRLPFLEGWGASFGVSYRHCLNPEVEGSGIFPTFKFSYSQVDNKPTNHGGDIRGQRAYVYTAGLGYAFNKHIIVNFNWVIADLDEKDRFGGPKDDRADQSDDIEHGWFVQVTAQF